MKNKKLNMVDYFLMIIDYLLVGLALFFQPVLTLGLVLVATWIIMSKHRRLIQDAVSDHWM